MQILDHADPLDLDVVQRPGVPELGAGRLRANGGRVVGVRVEGRIQIDQVDAAAVHAAHDR